MMEKRFSPSEVQLFLLLSAVITFGFCDGITAMLLIYLKGYSAEYSVILRYFAATSGLVSMFLFKVITVTALILLPVFLQKKDGSEVWKINGFLFAFVVGGFLASLDNISAITNGAPFIEPRTVIGSFIVLLIVLVEIGDIMDRRAKSSASKPPRQHLEFNNRVLLSEEQWIQQVHS
jgi:hypothetical protein